jgi:hypothetical protein
MPRPWKLVDVENVFSSVDNKHHPKLTVEAANGKRETFDHAEMYSPSGKQSKEYFKKYLKDPAGITKQNTIELPTEPIPTPAQKEPWEMTTDEFNREAKRQYEGQKPFQHDAEYKDSFDEKTGKPIKVAKKYTPIKPKVTEEVQSNFDRMRKLLIQKALSEGKSVPPEVLKDYPDLVKPPVVEAKDAEIKRVAGNILKNNSGVSQYDAEAMARDVIKNRKVSPATEQEPLKTHEEQGIILPETILHGAKVSPELIKKEGFLFGKNSRFGEAGFFSDSPDRSNEYAFDGDKIISVSPKDMKWLKVDTLEDEARLQQETGTKKLADAVRAKGYDGFIIPNDDPSVGNTFGIVNKSKLDSTIRQKQSPQITTLPYETPGILQDFGEKVGGARKDTAERGFTKVKKIKDEVNLPKWQKDYVAAEKVDGSGWAILSTKDKSRFGLRERGGQVFSTKEEAEKAIPLYAVAQSHTIRQSGQNNTWEIKKRVGDRKLFKVVNKEFAEREEAMKYMAAHAEQLLNTKISFGEEILPVPEIAIRKGAERRTTDATPEMFNETFSPRAIEFGNWNNQAERQQVLNHAYDGLLDLADTLKVSPKALMLNGDLAIAFGARGQGLSGAKAHYEPDYGVINLTKMKGAGSLAHEWFHALDHYLARLDTKAPSEKVKNERGDLVYPDVADKRAWLSHGPSYKSQLRAELKDSYKTLIKTMYSRAEQYVEDTQKADVFVGKARENLKTKLDKIRADLANDFTKQYTWRKNSVGLKPASAEQLADFDKIANILVEGGGLETKYQPSGKAGGWGGRLSNENLEALSKIYKAVRNRSGFTTEHSGTLDYLRADMHLYGQRLKMFKDAENKTPLTKMRPTNYAIEARKMDQARTGDYWSNPEEMAARAFASYVEDGVAKAGGQSDFLVYHAHGGILLPMIDGFVARPYPEGAERTALNNAFDKFVSILEQKTTPKGVSLGAAGQDLALASDEIPLSQLPQQPLKVRTEAGEKVTITPKEGEAFSVTPFQTAEGKVKYELHDGDSYVVPKNTAQDLVNRFGVKKVDKRESLITGAISQAGIPKVSERLSYNPEKIKATADVEKLFKQVSTQQGEFRGQRPVKASEEEIQRLADLVGITPEDLLKAKPGSIANAETTYAARQMVLDLSKDLSDYIKTIDTATATPEQLKIYNDKLMRLQGTMKAVAGLRTEASNLFRQFQYEVSPNEDAIIREMLSEVKRLDKDSAGNLEQFAQKTKELLEPTSADKFWHLWYASILSGPTTHLKNILGNTSQMGLELARIATTSPQNFPSALLGLLEGSVQGTKRMVGIFKHGQASKFELRGRKPIVFTGRITRILNAADYVGRTLEGVDSLFKGMSSGMELRQIARSQARSEGLRGKQLLILQRRF